MGCVILPSETARLVYGYLVKENLNDIALLFLEQSPYLMDCCQIVKSGYQFNTKLMGKNLQELLQEYSLIHNLVNKKVSSLCKTSLLYKRIKLRCENLPEILEFILFWKYKNCKSEESFSGEKSDKNTSGQEVTPNYEHSNNNEVTQNKNLNPSDNSSFNDCEQNSVQKTKLTCESYSVDSEHCNLNENQENIGGSFVTEKKQDKESVCAPVEVNEISGALQAENVNNKNDENRVNSRSTDLNLTGDILTLGVNSQCEDLVTNEISAGALTSLDGKSCFENQFKIVGVQESQNENHSLNVFTKSLVEEDNVNLESNPVVFVSPDINVALNPDQSQIIVIPIDYYKSQEEIQNAVITENRKVEENKNNVMFAEENCDAAPVVNSVLNSEQSNKTLAVDENIMTESDFLHNQTLVYNLEKEYEKATAPPVSKEPERVPVQSVPTQQLIVVSQTVPPRSSRFRTILPKKEPPVQIHPVVVVQPLLESAKDSKTNVLEPKRRDSCARSKKKTAKKGEKADSEVKASEIEKKEEKTNEEKENVKAEIKKTETPVFVRRRNSKRLSLSTPRRRSHIRALEFETPPKTNEENKKSRTSPKRVEHSNVERKCVRNTLFKSPTPEKQRPKIAKQPDLEPLNELSIPIATRSPNAKLSDAWENLTGVGCVIGPEPEPEPVPVKSPKKMWDADLRCFIPQNISNKEPVEKKRRKPERNQKDNRKSTKKKIIPSKRIKPITVSPSKISLTAKRNTYSINGNEEGSPVRSLDDLKLVTPFKDVESLHPTEETPLTKLLRENINTIDIDLSMINTPSFPPTPSIVITPDLDDVTVHGTNYYSPVKDCAKDKVFKITDYFRMDEKNNKKEMHEKVIDDLVSKAKEIIGLGKEQEENIMKRRPSGKILSMVKIQMLTQCDKKLMENIPINENFNEYNSTLTDQISKSDLKVELEEKRKRALKKIKVVKENLQNRNRVKRGRKRTRSGNCSKSDKSNESIKKGMVHSTPYSKGLPPKAFKKTDSDKKINLEVVEDIRQRFPPFHNSDKYPELNEKSRKKLHYVESFLKLPEIDKYIKEFGDVPPKLFLKPSLRRFFQVFYKWLKHPHKREVNASQETKAVLDEYLIAFDKISKGLSQRCKKLNKSETLTEGGCCQSDISRIDPGGKVLSDEEEREWKVKGERRKEEETEDGVVSTLPLKKRKSTVQQVEITKAEQQEKSESKASGAENASQTQNFLQDIDVDRFLSQIHGQENRENR